MKVGRRDNLRWKLAALFDLLLSSTAQSTRYGRLVLVPQWQSRCLRSTPSYRRLARLSSTPPGFSRNSSNISARLGARGAVACLDGSYYCIGRLGAAERRTGERRVERKRYAGSCFPSWGRALELTPALLQRRACSHSSRHLVSTTRRLGWKNSQRRTLRCPSPSLLDRSPQPSPTTPRLRSTPPSRTSKTAYSLSASKYTRRRTSRLRYRRSSRSGRLTTRELAPAPCLLAIR